MTDGHCMGAATKSYVAVIGVIAVVLLAGAWYVAGSPPSPGAPAAITLADVTYEPSGLVYIAQDRGYFSSNGLNVTLKEYSSGPAALAAVSGNEVEMALTSEYIVVGEAMKNRTIAIVGSIDKFQTVVIIGRKDRGIERIADLANKRVGITRGGIGEFHLGRFLALHGMTLEDVTLVDLPPASYEQAITDGRIDALVTGIYAYRIQEGLGSTAVTWSVQNDQNSFFGISSRRDWITGHPDEVTRMLQSLRMAEEYARDHPAEAQELIRNKLGYSEAQMADTWPDHRYALSLDSSMIMAMNDEARWMIANNLANATTQPNMREYVDPTALARVDPGAVTIL